MNNTKKIVKCLETRYNETIEVIATKVEEVYNETKTKVKLEPEILAAIFLKEDKILKLFQLVNPETCKIEVKKNIKKLYTYLDLQDFAYENLFINSNTLDVMRKYNITLNPQKIYENSLEELNLSGIYIDGELDDVILWYTDFTGHLGKVVINPQKIESKSLQGVNLSGVQIYGAFNDIDVRETIFKNSKGAIINPQLIAYKSLKGTILTDATIEGPLDHVNMKDTIFKGSKGAIIDLFTNIDIDKCTKKTDFTDVSVTDDIEKPTITYKLKGKNNEPVGIDKVNETRNQIFKEILNSEIEQSNTKKKIKTK